MAFDINTFCGRDRYSRFALDKPFTSAGHLYATNLYAVVRVPCGGPDTEPPTDKKLPPVTGLSYWREFPLTDATAIDLSGLTAEEWKVCEDCGEWGCPECYGAGEVEWDGDHSHHTYSGGDCKLCDGKGTLTEAEAKKLRRQPNKAAEPCSACDGTKRVRANEDGKRVVAGVTVDEGKLRLLVGLPGVRMAADRKRTALLFEGEFGVHGVIMRMAED